MLARPMPAMGAAERYTGCLNEGVYVYVYVWYVEVARLVECLHHNHHGKRKGSFSCRHACEALLLPVPENQQWQSNRAGGSVTGRNEYPQQ